MMGDKTIVLLLKLQKEGIVEELCPRREHWHFAVKKPEKLPESLKKEFRELGEIRW